jgi:hypothetical protein
VVVLALEGVVEGTECTNHDMGVSHQTVYNNT